MIFALLFFSYHTLGYSFLELHSEYIFCSFATVIISCEKKPMHARIQPQLH